MGLRSRPAPDLGVPVGLLEQTAWGRHRFGIKQPFKDLTKVELPLVIVGRALLLRVNRIRSFRYLGRRGDHGQGRRVGVGNTTNLLILLT